MSEHVPIVHVVGQTGRKLQEDHLMIHHSIGTSPDHQLYQKTSEKLRCAAAHLWNVESAPADIDRALRECVIQKLPVYIFFPIDMTNEVVSEDLLDRKLDLNFPVDGGSEEAALAAITDAIQKAKQPSIFIDFLTHSHGREETRALVEVLKWPLYGSHMSKGVINEDHERFVGLYNGNVSVPGVAEAMQSSDLVLALGWWPCDSNTAVFSRKISPENRIDVMDTYVIVSPLGILHDEYLFDTGQRRTLRPRFHGPALDEIGSSCQRSACLRSSDATHPSQRKEKCSPRNRREVVKDISAVHLASSRPFLERRRHTTGGHRYSIIWDAVMPIAERCNVPLTNLLRQYWTCDSMLSWR